MTCDIAPDRIYGQYKGDIRPKLKQWYDITRIQGCQLQSVAEEIRYSYDIDDATTFELDVLGRIVGVDRSFESVALNPAAFGKSQFDGSETQFGSAKLGDSQLVSNEIFRILIRAKIAKNNNDATYDGIVSALNYITPSIGITVIDNFDMSFSISFGQQLSYTQRFVLDTFDIVPRPQGVEFAGYVEESNITVFGGQFEWGDTRAQFGFTFGV